MIYVISVSFMTKKTRIAIFASGAGTNARNICTYFANSNTIEIAYLLSNKVTSGVPSIADEFSISYIIFNKEEFYNSDKIIKRLQEEKIDLIVLAGFLLLVPKKLIHSFENKIINIHPSLLPKYGGKGMYGMYVHEAVIANKEKETGITIHLVNEEYDKGSILFQKSVSIPPNSKAEDVARSIHLLEYKHLPLVIEEYIEQTFNNS